MNAADGDVGNQKNLALNVCVYIEGLPLSINNHKIIQLIQQGAVMHRR